MRETIEKHSGLFERQPMGPLGVYINMRQESNVQKFNMNAKIVQNALGSTLKTWLVASSKDQQTLKSIMYRRFKACPPIIQYKFSDKMDKISQNPFLSHSHDANDPLLRV